VRPAGARRHWLIHPFLAGIYFVLTLAASNAVSLNGWVELAWPIPTVLGLTAVTWLLAYAATRSAPKASLISLLWIIAFSLFGYVTEALLPSGALQLVGGDIGLLGLFLLMLFGPTLAIHRATRSLDPVNRYATLVTGLLVLYTGLQLARGLDQDRSQKILVPPPSSVAPGAAGSQPPDIYFLLLDQYTGSEVLADHFGYDNGAIEAFLKQRGFEIPRHSRTNYPQTQLSLAAMLNLDYVQRFPPQVHLFDLIENNRLAAFLKQRGYRFVFFPSGFSFTARNRNADLQLPEPTEVGSEFVGVWQRTTMLPELFEIACAMLGCRAGRFVYVSEDASLVDWKFAQLQGLAGGGAPTFAFAHIGLTHEPYLYHADCSHRDPYWPTDGGKLGDDEATRAYLDQITCVNRKIEAMVGAILSRSPRPPIIVLQSDHGHGRIGRHPPGLGALSAYQVRERMSVFSAYHFPGLSADSVSDSITPVNAIRLLLRYYFGADLPPREEASFWTTQSPPFEFVRLRDLR
jgi:hypothetical protein